MDKLKRCPFCGEEAELQESEPSTARFNEGCTSFIVRCSAFNCKVMPKPNLWHITPSDAISAWNTRSGE
jgi:hypothetical protein